MDESWVTYKLDFHNQKWCGEECTDLPLVLYPNEKPLLVIGNLTSGNLFLFTEDLWWKKHFMFDESFAYPSKGNFC